MILVLAAFVLPNQYKYMTMELELAIKTLKHALNSDQALLNTYTIEAAKFYYDEARSRGINVSDDILHEIANKASQRFWQVFAGDTSVASDSQSTSEPMLDVPQETSDSHSNTDMKKKGKK